MDLLIRRYPFLKFFKSNKLLWDNSIYSEMEDFPFGIREAKEILGHFSEKYVPIISVTMSTHKKLLATNDFIDKKPFLATCPETIGLLLLPETLTPKVVADDVEWRPQDLKMNCILFSVLKWSTIDTLRYGQQEVHDRKDYASEEDYCWEKSQYENCRWLHFLPVQLDKLFHIHGDSIKSVDEEFGQSYNSFGRDINGNIVDYIWSFVLYYHLNYLAVQPKPGTSNLLTCDQSNIILKI